MDPFTGFRKRLVYTGSHTVPRGVVVDPIITRYIEFILFIKSGPRIIQLCRI